LEFDFWPVTSIYAIQQRVHWTAVNRLLEGLVYGWESSSDPTLDCSIKPEFADFSFLVAIVLLVDIISVRKRERRVCYIIVQTYDVELHFRRPPMEFGAGTRPVASSDAPSSQACKGGCFLSFSVLDLISRNV